MSRQIPVLNARTPCCHIGIRTRKPGRHDTYPCPKCDKTYVLDIVPVADGLQQRLGARATFKCVWTRLGVQA